jgi:hypothetical protein
MRRIHSIEFHDRAWFPGPLRKAVTSVLADIEHLTRPYKHAAPLLAALCRRNGVMRLFDLCSGSAGPIPGVRAETEALLNRALYARMSDLYPDSIEPSSCDRITRESSSIDAMRARAQDAECFTMFTALHHFRPEQVKSMLTNFSNQQKPVAIFEVTSRSPLACAMVLVVGIFSVIVSPIRDFSWTRLAATIVPLIPAVVVWDGLVSNLRTYSPKELLELLPQSCPRYRWEAGSIRGPAGVPITFLIGEPMQARS